MADAYRVLIVPTARRELKRLPEDPRERIRRAIRGLASNPRPAGAAALRGAERVWRIRVGDHRVLYEIHDRELVVLVVKIGHRRDVYR